MQQEITQWYLVYTRPKLEKKVADYLKRRNLETFCPLNKIQKKVGDARKLSSAFLFPSRVFVRMSENNLDAVKKIDGVINFVHWLGKPARIREDEIVTIRHFVEDYRNVALEQTAINPADTVRMITSPVISQKGQVVSVKNKTVKVLLPSLGCILLAEPDAAQMTIIPGSKKGGLDLQPNRLAAI